MIGERFGVYDFGLGEEQEARARRLHGESIVIDTLFQGPCGERSFTEEMIEDVRREYEEDRDTEKALWGAWEAPVRLALRGEFPGFEECWRASGVTAGNRQIIGDEDALKWYGITQAQFDGFPWLIKALKAEDFRRAKREGKHAGFVSTQHPEEIGLDDLGHHHDLGLRMLQLTYNSANLIGGGCTDRADGGVTDHGVRFIGRMNDLGILVDASHCGPRTTLDACEISSAPVVVSHASASAVHPHARAKSDRELEAVAATGGYVGVYCVGTFLTDEPGPTIEHFLDHVDHIASFLGPEHVGIGSDWPMQLPPWGYERMAEMLPEMGFREEHNVDVLSNLVGFDDYRDFPNIARGLTARGYADGEIRGILGGNFLRVFERVCG